MSHERFNDVRYTAESFQSQKRPDSPTAFNLIKPTVCQPEISEEESRKTEKTNKEESLSKDSDKNKGDVSKPIKSLR